MKFEKKNSCYRALQGMLGNPTKVTYNTNVKHKHDTHIFQQNSSFSSSFESLTIFLLYKAGICSL